MDKDPMTREDPVSRQVRLTHHPVSNPMFPRPICNHDSEEWPCVTELQVREGLRLAASPADGAGASYADREVAVTGGVALRGPILASPADGAGVDPKTLDDLLDRDWGEIWDSLPDAPPYESAKRGTEQWVELFEAHGRGDDLGPIFERHVIEAGERIDAALAASPADGAEPTVSSRPLFDAGFEAGVKHERARLASPADGTESESDVRTLSCGCTVDDNQLLMTGPDCEDPSHQR